MTTRAMDEMFRWLDDAWRGGGLMPMDAFTRDDTYVLRFDLPGVSPDDVDVTVEGGMLTVTAARPREDVEGATWLVRERPHGTHRRQVRLSDRLDVSDLEAHYDQGVLTIIIPVRPEAKPRKVEVAIGGGDRKILEAKAESQNNS